MCGIAGILNLDGRPADPDELERLTNAMAHRGPDGVGFQRVAGVGLGHRRLAIIDLESGAQPMANEDRSLWLVFNGEIYNFAELRSQLVSAGHVFCTRSDSEVILHGYESWGQQVVHRLRGMFAFAIWDGNRQELFLARDRVGIKPLVYCWQGTRFAFASEVQALRGLSGFASVIDMAALDLYLHFQYIPAPHTAYASIRKLPPAHTMTVSATGTTRGPERYWDLRFEAARFISEADWVERLDAALAEAIKSHLVSDVPFGAFKSGGVDSSAVTAYMSRFLASPVRAFHIGYDDPECDETPYARSAAMAVGACFHTERVVPDALAALPELVRHHGEPFADSSAVCTHYVAQAARRHVKMVLSGDGGDETHGGYGYFANLARLYALPRGALPRARRRVGAFLRWLGWRRPAPSLADAWYDRSPYFGEALRRTLWQPEFQGLVAASREWSAAQFTPVRGEDPLDQCQYVDIHNYLVYDNLHKVDISSMAHGLEVRVPLLDHILLDTVRRIPPELRVRLAAAGTPGADHAEGKYLLKRATSVFFPERFYDRPKMGFSIPVSRWLAGPAHALARERILGSAAGLDRFFDVRRVRGLLEEHRSGAADHGHRLWALLFFSEWLAQEGARR